MGGDTFEVDPVAAMALVSEGALLLDVREDDEWDAGRAPGAVHVRLSDLPDRVDVTTGHRVVVCVCRAGSRSATAANFLIGEEVDARNLVGGMMAWESAGLPLEGSGDAPRVI